MASGFGKETESGDIAAKLWAAARSTVDLLTNSANENDSDSFLPIDNMLGKPFVHDEEEFNEHDVETDDMGLRIDAVFTLPLDTYLNGPDTQKISPTIAEGKTLEESSGQSAQLFEKELQTKSLPTEKAVEGDVDEKSRSTDQIVEGDLQTQSQAVENELQVKPQPLQQIVERELQEKAKVSVCKPFSVVLEYIDHDLSGRHRVFYRQWKRRFNKCSTSCRYKYIDSILRPKPLIKKARKKYTYKRKQDLPKSEDELSSSVEDTPGVIQGNDRVSNEASGQVKYTKYGMPLDTKKSKMKRSMIQMKHLSKRDKLRYQFINQMSSKHTERYRHPKGSVHDETNIAHDETNIAHDETNIAHDETNIAHDETKKDIIPSGNMGTKMTVAGTFSYTRKTYDKMKSNNQPGTNLKQPSSEIKTSTTVKVKIEPGLESTSLASVPVPPTAAFSSRHLLVQKARELQEKCDDIQRKKRCAVSDMVKVKTEPGLSTANEVQRSSVKSASEVDPYAILKRIISNESKHPKKNEQNLSNVEKKMVPITTSNQYYSQQNFGRVPFSGTSALSSSVLPKTTSWKPKVTLPMRYGTNQVNAVANNNRNLTKDGKNVLPNAINFGTGNQIQPGALPFLQNSQLLMTNVNQPGSQQPPLQLVLTSGNQPMSIPSQQLVITNSNQPTSNQNLSQLILTNANPTGTPQFVIANANQSLPTSHQSSPQLILSSAHASTANAGSTPQFAYTNNNVQYAIANAKQGAPSDETKQIILHQITQQIQQLQRGVQPQIISIQPALPAGQSSMVNNQPIPVIQTSKVLPNTMDFPPGTLFLHRNSLPMSTQSGITGTTVLSPADVCRQTKATTIVSNSSNPVPPVNIHGTRDPSQPLQAKTVMIGNQKYLLVPTVGTDYPGPDKTGAGGVPTKLQHADISSSTTSHTNTKLLSATPANVLQQQKPPPVYKSNTPTEPKIVHGPIWHVPTSDNEVRQLSIPVTCGAQQVTPRPPSFAIGAGEQGAHANTPNAEKIGQPRLASYDDVILIDDVESSDGRRQVSALSSGTKERKPRKSKPLPRVDYDDFAKKSRRKPRTIYQETSDNSTDSDVDSEITEMYARRRDARKASGMSRVCQVYNDESTDSDVEGEIAENGMLIPKTPRMPTGVRQWPDGATIQEKKVTLPDNILQELQSKPMTYWQSIGQGND